MIYLHIHSNYSDGNKKIDEIISLCYEKEIDTISICDHNTIKGILNNQFNGINLINGIEFYGFKENIKGFHLLAYDFNITNEMSQLLDYLAYQRYLFIKKN